MKVMLETMFLQKLLTYCYEKKEKEKRKKRKEKKEKKKRKKRLMQPPYRASHKPG